MKAILLAIFALALPIFAQTGGGNKEKARLQTNLQVLEGYQTCFRPLFNADAQTMRDGYLRVISRNKPMEPLDFLVELKVLRDHGFNWTVQERFEIMSDSNEAWSFPRRYKNQAKAELDNCK